MIIPLNVPYHIWFIHSSVDGRLTYLHVLVIVNDATRTTVYKYLFESLFSILLGTCLEAELLHHMAILCLNVQGTTTLLSITAAPFYIPTNSTQGSRFLHLLVV